MRSQSEQEYQREREMFDRATAELSRIRNSFHRRARRLAIEIVWRRHESEVIDVELAIRQGSLE